MLAEVVIGQTRLPQYEAYIANYSQIAIEQMNEYGIPASITLAQGILESGAGQARLAIEANNHFGIKCHKEWTGETVYHDDDTLQECFRKYSVVKESYEDHSKFLTTRDRYASLFQLDRTDYKSWAKGLKTAGYATDINYPDRLIKIIEDYELFNLDNSTDVKKKSNYLTEEKKENIPPKKGTVTYKKIIQSKVIVANKKDDNPGDKKDEKVIDKSTKIVYSDRMIGQVSAYSSHEVKKINGVKYVVAQKNDSYESIADEFSLKVHEIYSINDVPKSTKLQAGEIVYIRDKKSTAINSFHIVQEDETMRDIAQKYGIRLKSLCNKNNMEIDAQPSIGQKLNLK
jgi:LysM repeat protein